MSSTSPFTLPALALLLTASCATAPPPPAGQAASDEASAAVLRAAEEVGASKNPQAGLHLQYAKEQMQLANKLTGEDAERRAPGLLMRAQADAELAIALARSADVNARAKAVAAQLKQTQPARR